MSSCTKRNCGLVVFCLCLMLGSVAGQQAPAPGLQPLTAMPSVIQVPPEAQPSPNFNAEAATNAYLAQIPADARARSDAYFEGGYWMILWDFLYGAVILLLLLNLGWSAGMRNLAERVTRFKPVHTIVYWVQYVLLTSILGFPLSVYEDYLREHKYGLATQTFGPWMSDQLKGLGVNVVLGGILVMLLFGIVRRLQRTWWIWGSFVTVCFMILVVLIAPVYIIPIFNKVTRLDDPKVTQPILSLARANGIPAHDVFEIDASRQTTRMSANVSGFGNTMRITLNDNLLRRGSPEEIQAVMGHEMGHYVLHHIYKDTLFFRRRHCDRLRSAAVVAELVFAALGREMADPWHWRYGSAASGTLAGVDLLFYPDADFEYARPHHRGRGRHVRFERQSPARWFRPGSDSPRGISQDESGTGGGVDLL